jgi:hypothetical protein
MVKFKSIPVQINTRTEQVQSIRVFTLCTNSYSSNAYRIIEIAEIVGVWPHSNTFVFTCSHEVMRTQQITRKKNPNSQKDNRLTWMQIKRLERVRGREQSPATLEGVSGEDWVRDWGSLCWWKQRTCLSWLRIGNSEGEDEEEAAYVFEFFFCC